MRVSRFQLHSVALIVCAVLSSAAAAAPLVQEQKFDFGRLAMSRFTLQDKEGAPVRYYLSTPAAKSPLVLYIQGSGCTPPFLGLDTPARASTIFSWIPLAAQGRHAVMAVDKPHQGSGQQQGQPGTAIGCPQAFNEHFSYDSWLATLKRALQHALTQPTVDASRVLVIGISEGATMAAGLARTLPGITHVALVGATGPTQLYDFAANIHRSGNDDTVKAGKLQELDATLDQIHAYPNSTSKLAWGHTYLRWSSFLAQSSSENLAQSRARIYLVSGMRDDNVPILSTEVLYAQLRTQGRDVGFRRVPAANHGLVPEGGSMAQVQTEYDAIIAWFEQR